MNVSELKIGVTLKNAGEIREKIAAAITALQGLKEALDGMEAETEIPGNL